MRNETIGREQVLGLLETAQEFIDTNPNEVTTLADSKLLVDAVYADLNRHVTPGEHRHLIALGQ
jgi:hypothetical protein